MRKIIERDEHLDRLRAALRLARDGHGRVAFVAGEAGVGKTALVEAFLDEVDDESRVAIGRCESLAIPRALGPFVDVAAALGVGEAGDRDVLLAALLRSLRHGPPAVVVIEDAHWADIATIDLLAMLGRRAVEVPLVLIVTYREEEVGAGHPLRQALGHLATASGAVWLGLEPLSRHGVRELARSAGVDADEVYALTGGNPFYVTETLAAPAGSIATNVRLAVLARVSRISPAARRVLDAVAVVPGRTEAWLLEALCRPQPADVDECLAAGVLVADRGTYAFRHELARRAVEREESDSARRELHRRAVGALAGGVGSDPARVAHHAEWAGDPERLVDASAAACRQALERGAFDSAVTHGRRALQCLQQGVTRNEDMAAALRLDLATAMWAFDNDDAAIPLAQAAVAHWRSVGDARREAAALVELSRMLTGSGRTEAAAAALSRAVSLLETGRPSPELALAYVGMAGAHMLARERDAAVRWGSEAIDLATRLDAPHVLARALVQTGTADVMDGRLGGLQQIRRGIEIAEASGVATVAVLGYLQIGSGCGEMRRYDLAVPALLQGISYADSHSLEDPRRYCVAWLARCRFDGGKWVESERLANDVLTRGGASISRFVALNTLGWLRARRGDPDVWQLLDEALEFARRTGHLQRLWPCAVARAEAGWLEGNLAPHVPLLEELVDLAARCRHAVALGELGMWLARAGQPFEQPCAEPFATWIRGDHAAAAGFRDLGCPYESAAALAEVGGAGALTRALTALDDLGANPLAERVAGELRRLGVAVSRTTHHVPGGELSRRELEVIRLVAAGFTNPQIASALFISRKTAEHHVSNILTKLGVTSRVEAAAAAVRRGISGT